MRTSWPFERTIPNYRPFGLQASQTLTCTGAFIATETVVIDGDTFTYGTAPWVVTSPTITTKAQLIQKQLEALCNAINGGLDNQATAGDGSNFDVARPYAAYYATNKLLVQAVQPGTAGNAITTTETCANASFGAATMAGGVDSDLLAASTPATKVASDALAASLVAKNAAATLLGVYGYNSKSSDQYIQIHDASSLPADTAVPEFSFRAAAEDNFFWTPPGDAGVSFGTGVTVCNSSTAATKTIGAADCWFTVIYRTN